MKRILIFLLVLLFFPLGWAHATAVGPGEYPMGGRYIGVLLCADCAGVWTEVTLEDPGPDAGQGSGTFVMTERFTGGLHGGTTVTTRGLWSTVEWAKGTSFTGTLELRDENDDVKTRGPWHFYCDHGRSLSLLDKNGRGLDTLKPVILHRVIPPPEPVFGPVTEAESGTILMGRVGDIFEIDLPAASLMDSRQAWTMKQSTSHSVALEVTFGSGEQNVFSTCFRLKAVTPGRARMEFLSAENPAHTVTFAFEVAP